MKKSELIKIIRTAVRQEISESLPKIISEMLNQTQITEKLDTNDISKKVIKNASQQKQIKKFSKNEALNKVLNETVGGIPQEGSMVTGGADEVTDFNGNSVNVNELPDHVSSALTRNYSDVLKLVDKKKGKTT